MGISEITIVKYLHVHRIGRKPNSLIISYYFHFEPANHYSSEVVCEEKVIITSRQKC